MSLGETTTLLQAIAASMLTGLIGAGYVIYRLRQHLATAREHNSQLTGKLAERDQVVADRDQFFSVSLDLLGIAGTDGYFKRLNPAFEALLGHTEAEMCAQPAVSFVHPDDIAPTLAQIAAQAGGAEILSFENRYRCKDGSYRWLSWKSKPVGFYTYGAARDITAIKAAEAEIKALQFDLEKRVEDRTAALFQRERQLRLITDALPALVGYIDPELKYQFANQTYAQWFGTEPAQILGKSVQDVVGADFFGKVEQYLRTCLAGEVVTGDVAVTQNNGVNRHIRAHYMPDFDGQGKVRGVVVLVNDVTEQRQQEAERSRLMASEEAAVKSAQAKSEFLANMSHEIRTPINGVIGMAGLLLDTKLDSEQRGYSEAVKQSATALLAVVNDILDLSKIEAGILDFEAADFDLGQLVERCMQQLRFAAAAKQLAFVADLPAGVSAMVKGDSGRIGQVLINLINNALKFTASGHVSVKLQMGDDLPTGDAVESPAVVSPIDSEMVKFKVSVQDSGIGLAPATIDRLFKPFSQADSSTTRRYGGTGLGLSICKRLIETMGGEIGVASEEGSGSTFWFTLALPRAFAVISSAPPETAALHAARSAHILVAEDNQINQIITVKMLEKLGYSADCVLNGREALAALAKTAYDLILMDCQMPEMDGYEATVHIRAAVGRLNHGIPIIALTANAMKGDQEKCLAVGMNDYVTKPVKTEALAKAIAQALAPLAPKIASAG